MKNLLILFCALSISGCASNLANALPAWWTAHKAALLETGAAAGAATQIEQFGLTTEAVIEKAKGE